MGTLKVRNGASWERVAQQVQVVRDPNLLPGFDVENGSGGFSPYGYFWKTGAPVCSVETDLAHVYRGQKAQKVVLAAGEMQRVGSTVFAAQSGSIVELQLAAKVAAAGCKVSLSLFSVGPPDTNPDLFATGVTQQHMPFYPGTSYDVLQTTFQVPTGHNLIRVYYTIENVTGSSATVWLDAPLLKITEAITPPTPQIAKMRQTATQSIASASTTALTWDEARYNPSGWTTGSSGITVPATGLARVTLQVALNNANVTTGIMQATVTLNGTAQQVITRTTPVSSSPTVINGTATIPVTGGDVIGGSCFQGTGAARNLYGGSTYETTLEVEML